MSRIISPPMRIIAGTPAAPQWVLDAIAAGWKTGEWLAISGNSPTAGYGLTPTNTMISTKSTPTRGGGLQSGMSAYSGAVLVPPAYDATTHGSSGKGTYIMGPSGGNGGYHGNDVFAFDIGSRTWREFKADYQPEPDEHPSHPLGNEYGEYRDGSMLNNHLVAKLDYIPDINAWYFPRGYTDSTSAIIYAPSPYGHTLGMATRAWTRCAPITDLVPERRGWVFWGSGAYIPSIKRYVLNANNVGRSFDCFLATYDPLEDVWDAEYSYPGFSTSGSHSATAYDPIYDRVVFFETHTPDVIKFRPAQNLSAATTITTITGKPANLPGAASVAWSPNLGGWTFTSLGYAKTVYVILPNAGSTWQMSKISDDEGAVTPQYHGSDAGLYARGRIATYGDIDILFTGGLVGGPVNAFRVT